MSDLSEPKWVTVAAAAEWLDVSVVTMRGYIRAGLVDALRFGPRLIRVDLASVQRMGVPVVDSDFD